MDSLLRIVCDFVCNRGTIPRVGLHDYDFSCRWWRRTVSRRPCTKSLRYCISLTSQSNIFLQLSPNLFHVEAYCTSLSPKHLDMVYTTAFPLPAMLSSYVLAVASRLVDLAVASVRMVYPSPQLWAIRHASNRPGQRGVRADQTRSNSLFAPLFSPNQFSSYFL